MTSSTPFMAFVSDLFINGKGIVTDGILGRKSVAVCDLALRVWSVVRPLNETVTSVIASSMSFTSERSASHIVYRPTYGILIRRFRWHDRKLQSEKNAMSLKN